MNWKRLANWHEDDWIVARLQEAPGQLVLLVAVALLLPSEVRVAGTAAAGLVMVAPARRDAILAAGALWILYERLPDAVRSSGPAAVAVGATWTVALLVACFAVARGFRTLPSLLRRFPMAALHVTLLVLLGACTFAATRGYGGAVWGAGTVSLAALIPFLLWRSSYLLLSGRRGTLGASRLRDHLAWWFPLWGGTVTPYGKGFDYLQQQRVTEGAALARCRASGLKLLLLALIWGWVRQGLDQVTTSGVALPPWLGGASIIVPDLTLAISSGPDRYSFAERWGSTIVEFLRSIAQMAARGHVIIGLLRLFGFNVFRNTYKPLLSTTIVEFWNRYYYYFKELMVEFFFYPTFVGLAGRRAEVRLVVSVLAAATLGNLYYHVVMDYRALLGIGLDQVLQVVGGRAIYCVLLGVGVAVSMLRERRRRRAGAVPGASPFPLRALRGMLGVWFFYAMLHIWNIGRHTLSIPERTSFLLSLAGL